MPLFGICTGTAASTAAKQAGWDFIEENVQSLFKGAEPDDKYDGQEKIAASALPIYAANCLIPSGLKITGPSVDMDSLRRYASNVLRRADQANCRRLVFGSGAARRVPEDWDKARATEQIVEFGKMIAPIAQENRVIIVLEHLSRSECNIVNDLTEELSIVRRVNHPAFRALLDTYHFWIDALPMSQIEPLLPHIEHVHLADREGRVPPGESQTSDYRPIFSLLRRAGYDGGLSVEATGFGDIAAAGPRVLAFLKRQWNQA